VNATLVLQCLLGSLGAVSDSRKPPIKKQFRSASNLVNLNKEIMELMLGMSGTQ